MNLPTFAEIQDQIKSVAIREVIFSLDSLAAVDIAGRLLQSALELSESTLRRDRTQLAVQLMIRLRPYRHVVGIAAFLSTITLPAGTFEGLDIKGLSTYIASYFGKLTLDVFQIVVSEAEYSYYSGFLLQQRGWFTLTDGRPIRYNTSNRGFEIDDAGQVKPFPHKVFRKVRKRYSVYPQQRYHLRSGRELIIFHSGIMLLIDPQTLQAVMMEEHIYSVRGVLELTDGRILSWSGDYTLRLWQSDGTPITALHGHNAGVWGVLELPDGRILSWSKDKTIRLWTSDGQPIAVMQGHTKAINEVKRLSDGRFLSFSQDQTMRVWSADGESLLEMVGHQKWVTDAVELSNGWFVSWAILEPFLRIWDTQGKLQATVELKHQTSSHYKLDVLEAEKLYEQLQSLPHLPNAT